MPRFGGAEGSESLPCSRMLQAAPQLSDGSLKLWQSWGTEVRACWGDVRSTSTHPLCIHTPQSLISISGPSMRCKSTWKMQERS